MFGLEELLSIAFVLFALSTFAILLILRFNKKRIEHKGELVQKDAEKDIAIKQTAFETQEAERNVREVSHDLVPAVLYELGLPTALKSISQQLDNMSGLHSKAHIDPDLPKMDKKKELAIYRIVQESVNNAIKHANASTIDISLNSEDGEVTAKISDNGSGIPQDKKDATGLGLSNMRERAAVFNGFIEIQSSSDVGTSVLLKFFQINTGGNVRKIENRDCR